MKSHSLSQTLDWLSVGALAGLVFLLPLFFVPSSASPFEFSKTILAIAVGIFSLSLFVWARMRDGRITLITHPLFWAGWAIVAAYLLSLLFSDAIEVSLFGQQFETHTFAFVTLAVLLFSLVSLLVKTARQHLLFLGAFALAALILGAYEVVHVLTGADVTSLSLFNSPLANPLGKWNDVAVFFGGVILATFVVLEGIPNRSRLVSAFCYALFFVSLGVAAFVNFSIVWIVLVLIGAGFFIYTLYQNRLSALRNKDGESIVVGNGRYSTMFLSIVLIAVSCAFLFTAFGDSLSSALGVAQAEARPSWGSTVSVLEQTYRNNAVFGSGPNTFTKAWAAFKPQVVNLTPFWNANFSSGVGYIPTAFVTTGIVGGLAWLLFLGILFFFGIRVAYASVAESDRFARFLSLSWFFLAFYFFVMAFVYTPGVVNILLAFLFAGLFVASIFPSIASVQDADDSVDEKAYARIISFVSSPRVGFVSVLLLIFTLGIGILGAYAAGERYAAAYYFSLSNRALVEDGDVERAKEYMLTAIELVPADRYRRAAADISMAQLSRIINDNPEPTAQVHEQFRSILSEAVTHVVAARDYNPGFYQNWLASASIYGAVAPLGIEGAYENAASALDQAASLNPFNPRIDLQRARLEIARGDAQAARAAIASALQKKNNYTEAVFLLAQLEINEGNIEGAIESAEAALVLEPNNAVVPFQLGVLYYQNGDYTDARGAFERAIQLDNDYANALFFLGLTHYELGNTTAATAQFERVAFLNPDNEDVLTVLSNLRSGLAPFATSTDSGELDTLPVEE